MPRLTLVYPCIGRFPGQRYIRSWQMQPLGMAVLAGLTPPDWETAFFDDRLEEVDYDRPADLAAVSIETFTARRGYQIASQFKARGVPVVMGGYHATFCSEEVLCHADAVCVGEAEEVWSQILADARAGRLQPRYEAPRRKTLAGIRPDRRIFRDKNYFSIALVETGRGCPHSCDFCSITSFYQATCRRRPVPDILDELRQLRERYIFFVDDNIAGDRQSATEMFYALKPLKVKWVSQATISVGRDEKLLNLMAESGCIGLLIGFESLSNGNLVEMGKSANRTEEYRAEIARIRQAGIALYGTFMFGLPGDTPEIFTDTVNFAREQRMYLAAFNHIVPFPGTPLYRKIRNGRRFPSDAWWLEEGHRVGDIPFRTAGLDSREVEQRCLDSRRAFFSLPSILERGRDIRTNCRTWKKAAAFFSLNLMMRSEITRKKDIPLGLQSAPGIQ